MWKPFLPGAKRMKMLSPARDKNPVPGIVAWYPRRVGAAKARTAVLPVHAATGLGELALRRLPLPRACSRTPLRCRPMPVLRCPEDSLRGESCFWPCALPGSPGLFRAMHAHGQAAHGPGWAASAVCTGSVRLCGVRSSCGQRGQPLRLVGRCCRMRNWLAGFQPAQWSRRNTSVVPLLAAGLKR